MNFHLNPTTRKGAAWMACFFFLCALVHAWPPVPHPYLLAVTAWVFGTYCQQAWGRHGEE